MWFATCAWALLVIGYLFRKNTRIHIPLMLTGIGMDFALVLCLQVTRSALETALEFSLSPLQQIHIGFSTLALIFYFPTLFFGYRLIQARKNNHHEKKARLRKCHILFAIGALISRTAGFFFMFSMWK